jgi:hypothetical protein
MRGRAAGRKAVDRLVQPVEIQNRIERRVAVDGDVALARAVLTEFSVGVSRAALVLIRLDDLKQVKCLVNSWMSPV